MLLTTLTCVLSTCTAYGVSLTIQDTFTANLAPFSTTKARVPSCYDRQ